MKPFRRIISIIVCLILLLSCSFTALGTTGSSTAVIDVDGTNLTAISENLFGIFFEDINFAADGGLYAEKIVNRSFEFTKIAKKDQMYGWQTVGTVDAEVTVNDFIGALNENNRNYLTAHHITSKVFYNFITL